VGYVKNMTAHQCKRFDVLIDVKGTIKAQPLALINGKEKLTLRFDCKPRKRPAAPSPSARTPAPGTPHAGKPAAP